MDSYEKKQLQYKYILITVILVCLVAIISSTVTYHYYFDNNSLKKYTVESNSTSDETIDAISNTLKGFRKIIDSNFKGKIDEAKLLDGAIKGYVNGLDDKYSEYMTAEEWEEFQTIALGDFEGIGIYVSLDKNNNVVILSTIKESPAEAIGLKEKDVIVEVDGENVLGVKDASEVTSKIKGPSGTKVHLKIARGDEYLEFDVNRDVVKIYHVDSKIIEDDIGYISLYTFDTDCSVEVEKAIKELEKEGAKKIILDLRNNTGGLVSEAYKISNLFIPKDKDILITEYSNGTKEISKTKSNNISNMELILLVNEYSASASEILAGALKDNNRAKIVGTTTYGKGIIQQVFSLLDGSVLKLTIAEYYTPNGTKIHEIGLEPDVKVELPDIEDEKDFVDTQLNKAIELLK
ncbi:MAG: S41 family peptidase [Clostridia bacterium]|nr:S41 family peptidase [Clostridia bacterium]